MAKFELNRFSNQERVLGGGAVVALIALFLPWYGASSGGFSASVSGWSTSYGWLGALLIVAAGVYLVMLRSGVNLGQVPASPPVVILGATLLGTLIVIIRWATLPSGHIGFAGVTVLSYGPEIGIYLALIAGVVESICAVLMFRSSGEKLPWANRPASPPPAA